VGREPWGREIEVERYLLDLRPVAPTATLDA
jgi:hypothetical protein